MSNNEMSNVLLHFAEVDRNSLVDYNMICVKNATYFCTNLTDYLLKLSGCTACKSRRIQYIQLIHDKLMEHTDIYSYIDKGMNCVSAFTFAHDLMPMLLSMGKN